MTVGWVLAAAFTVLCYLAGDVLAARFLPRLTGLARIAGAYLLGTLFSTWIAFLAARALHPFTERALTLATALTAVLLAGVCALGWKRLAHPVLSLRETIGLLAACAFGAALFFHTFDYEPDTGRIHVSRLIWSDYAFHVPLIRSFSLGHNFGLDHPLFAHESVRYHFLFDFRAGLLENLGFPLDHAINVDGAASFAAFLLVLYAFTTRMFWGKRPLGLIAIVLFLFNSSLSWVEFLKKYPPESFTGLFQSWWTLSDYVAWGPWDGKPISAFWTWNIYINQRHLLSGFGLALLVLYAVIDRLLPADEREPDGLPRARRVRRPELAAEAPEAPAVAEPDAVPAEAPAPATPAHKPWTGWEHHVFVGVVAGLLMFWHGSAYVGLVGMLGLFFLLFPGRRETLLVLGVAAVLGLPQVRWFQQPSEELVHHSLWHPGFLAENMLMIPPGESTFLRYVSLLLTLPYYWFMNIGLVLILLPAAYFLVDPPRRKLLLIFSSLFAITNLFQFGSELATNHKFVNLWLALTAGFTGYLLLKVYRTGMAGRTAAALLLLFCTLAGIVEIPAVKNVGHIDLPDVANEPVQKWIQENTDPHAVFLTPVRLYHPAGLAGRLAMVGWGYFAESAGYRKGLRGEVVRALFSPPTKEEFCARIRGQGIDYVEVEPADNSAGLPVDVTFFAMHFTPVFENDSHLRERIYDVRQMCPDGAR